VSALALHHMSFVTPLSTSEGRQDVDGVAGQQGGCLVPYGDSVAQARATAQHCGEVTPRFGEVIEQLRHGGARAQHNRF